MKGVKMITLKKIAIVITAGLLIQGCISRAAYRNLETKYNTDVAGMSEHIKNLGEYNKAISQENQNFSFELQKLKLKNEELIYKSKVDEETITRIKESILKKLQGLGGEPGVIITDKGVEIQGEVLFAPGQAELKQKGKEILNKVADIIKSEPGYLVQITGHTDSDPIVQTATRWTTKSNFELAAYRALTVLLHLEEQGVDPARLFLTSFGEHRPKSAKKSENRRVEICFIKTTPEKEEPTTPEEKPEGPKNPEEPKSTEPSK
jgi:flagellar motor protein MotB